MRTLPSAHAPGHWATTTHFADTHPLQRLPQHLQPPRHALRAVQRPLRGGQQVGQQRVGAAAVADASSLGGGGGAGASQRACGAAWERWPWPRQEAAGATG